MNNDYTEIVESLRLKYNITGKDGEKLVKYEELKNGGFSYKVFNKLAVKVVFKKTFTRLLVKSPLLKYEAVDLGLRVPHPMNDDSDMQGIEFQLEESVINYINEFLDLAIITYDAPKEFGCCSRYKECSDKKECINPNKIRAKQCYYRDNIEKGIILY